ncbi:isoprenylcysteine carboxylmethyltransferase family protein [Candidatus Bathyarchaeota archaeon]|nr:isoprenylcysteine carboxylmethyltransferase family protein [Candidatus Bathyarchaeota archaeon]
MNLAEFRKLLLVIPSSVIFFLIVPAVSVLFGEKLDAFLGFSPMEPGTVGIALAVILLVVGGYYVLESIRILFTDGKGIPLGDIIPEEQTTELITTGIYSQTRNPMLFGYILCLIALGIYMKSWSIALLIPTLFTAIWTVWLKKQEEPALELRFGDTYLKYREKTPYLFPRLNKTKAYIELEKNLSKWQT